MKGHDHENTSDLLGARDFSLCTAETDEEPVKEIVGGASWGYLRLRRTQYAEDDLSRWLELVRAKEWEQAFVFFKHEEEGTGAVLGPELALRFQELACSAGA
jgi:uncharacterized protein YecE (DUF72 family)